MRYQVTTENQTALTEILSLIRDTRPRLAFVDSTTSAAWDLMRHRFPSGDDVRQGFISLSQSELEEVRTQLQQFKVQVTDEMRFSARADAAALALAPSWGGFRGEDAQPALAS